MNELGSTARREAVMTDQDALPVACSLSSVVLEDRMDAWRSVMAEALSVKSAQKDGVRLEFRPTMGAAHALLDLVAAERECCGWADWILTNSATGTVLTVRAEGSGAQVLREMFQVSP